MESRAAEESEDMKKKFSLKTLQESVASIVTADMGKPIVVQYDYTAEELYEERAQLCHSQGISY
ncbi:MAG: hypothetical protein ACRCZZ_04845 [Phocaeicola sp.]